MTITEKFITAIRACFIPSFIIASSFPYHFTCANLRTIKLFHLMRPKSFPTNWAYLLGSNNKPVSFIMAIWAKGYSIIYIISKLRIFSPLFNMMGLEYTANSPALLTGKTITAYNCNSPFSIFHSTLCNVSFSGAPCFPSLIIRKIIPFIHSIIVRFLTVSRTKHSFSAIRYFFSTLWAFIKAVPRTILFRVTFVFYFKFALTEFTSSNHNLLQIKTPARLVVRLLSHTRTTAQGCIRIIPLRKRLDNYSCV